MILLSQLFIGRRYLNVCKRMGVLLRYNCFKIYKFQVKFSHLYKMRDEIGSCHLRIKKIYSYNCVLKDTVKFPIKLTTIDIYIPKKEISIVISYYIQCSLVV